MKTGDFKEMFIGLFVVAIFMCAAAIAENSLLLYDVDFSSPPHTVGQTVVSGDGPAPRKTPSCIPFGSPQVVSSCGALTDQPCRFSNGQLTFTIMGFDSTDIGKAFDYFLIEADILIDNLSESLTILFDTPTVKSLDFKSDGTMRTFTGTSRSLGDYPRGTVFNLTMGVDLTLGKCYIYINEVYRGSMSWSGGYIRSFRISQLDEASGFVAIDNFKVWGLSSSPMLVLSAPDGGEALIAGKDYEVSWHTLGAVESVIIEYSVDGGFSWIETSPPNEYNDDKYIWNVPDVASNLCMVRILSSYGGYSDMSRGMFSILSSEYDSRCMTFDPPVNPGGDANVYNGWTEMGMTVIPDDYMYSSQGKTGRPSNGTGNLFFISSGGSPEILPVEDKLFRLISVDLDDYSDYFSNAVVTFLGYRYDGSVVSQNFRVGSEVFQTFYFDEGFDELLYAESTTSSFSMDNLVFQYIDATSVQLIDLEISGPEQVFEDGSAQFTATAVYSDESTADVSNLVDWHLSSDEYATIDMSGLVVCGGLDYEGVFGVSASYTEDDIIVTDNMEVAYFPLLWTYHVNSLVGSNANDGLSAESAFATIQCAIDSSEDGDIILVWPGIYTENIIYDGKAVMIQGTGGLPVIDGGGYWAVSFFNNEGQDSVLRNVLVTNSYMGIFISGSSPTISNVNVLNNMFGIEAYSGSEPKIANCILWDNSDGDIYGSEIRYCCVERASEAVGEGNISEQPMFVNASEGDYHLRSKFGRYMPEIDMWVIDEVTSPCVNAGDPEINPSEETMPNGGRINIGAFGGTVDASRGAWVLEGDINQDGFVNLLDFAIMTQNWLMSLPWVE